MGLEKAIVTEELTTALIRNGDVRLVSTATHACQKGADGCMAHLEASEGCPLQARKINI